MLLPRMIRKRVGLSVNNPRIMISQCVDKKRKELQRKRGIIIFYGP
jgi:hypothetical protein